MRRAFLICVIVGICACDLLRGSGAGVLLEPELASAPLNEFEELVAAALERALVTEKDIPDYGLLRDPNTILVSSVTHEGDTLSPGALPHSKDVGFILATPEQIQEIANEEGDFVFVDVGNVDIEDQDATIQLHTEWARGEGSDVVYLSGGGYDLLYRRDGEGWGFVKILGMWIS